VSRGLARAGDRTYGTCFHPSHSSPNPTGGTIISGAPSVTSSNISDARIGDLVVTDCGHLDVIISGSPTVTADNIGTARVGDQVGARGIYIATIISGDPRTTTP